MGNVVVLITFTLSCLLICRSLSNTAISASRSHVTDSSSHHIKSNDNRKLSTCHKIPYNTALHSNKQVSRNNIIRTLCPNELLLLVRSQIKETLLYFVANLPCWNLWHFAIFQRKLCDPTLSHFVTIHSRHRRQMTDRQTICYDNSRTLQCNF